MSITTQYHSILGTSAVFTLLAMLALPYNVVAAPLHLPHLAADNSGKEGSLWKAEVFHDPHTTQHYLVSDSLCFQYVGQQINPFDSQPISTQDKYNWCAIELGWEGDATKEGDQVFMHHSDKDGTRNAAQWELSSQDEGAGHWRYWDNDSMQNLNVTFVRTRESCSCQ